MPAPAFSLSVTVLMSFPLQPVQDKKSPTPEAVRRLAAANSNWIARGTLREYGEKAFPAFEVILRDPKSTADEIGGVIGALNFIPANRRRFRPLVAPYLAHAEAGVRHTAVGLMVEIGTIEEGPILVALLSDENTVIGNQAATALAKTGGRTEVIAMDAWLRGGSAHRGNGDYLIHVKKCRDELEKRLNANPIPKDLKD